jgi:hypothetical protein
LLQVENKTPFVPAMFVFPDEEGVDTLYVAVEVIFDIGQDGRLLGSTIRAVEEHGGLLRTPGRCVAVGSYQPRGWRKRLSQAQVASSSAKRPANAPWSLSLIGARARSTSM